MKTIITASTPTHTVLAVQAAIRDLLETNGSVTPLDLRHCCGSTCSTNSMLSAACKTITGMFNCIETYKSSIELSSAATAQDEQDAPDDLFSPEALVAGLRMMQAQGLLDEEGYSTLDDADTIDLRTGFAG